LQVSALSAPQVHDREPTQDAALLTSPRFQRQLAAALLAAILAFLGK
jgi:hypothetical protein